MTSQSGRDEIPDEIPDELPDGLDRVRTTPEFDAATVPAGLLDVHRVAVGVWGRLVVRSGSLEFRFEDRPGASRRIAAGEHQIIPPEVPHRVLIVGPVRFVVEFHRPRGLR